MAASDDRALAARFNEARGDRSIIDAVMWQQGRLGHHARLPARWPLRGLDAVLTDFLGPVSALFASMAAQPETLLADDDGHVTVIGHYAGAGRDGGAVDCRFVHVLTVTDGKLSHLHQTADSHLVYGLIGEPNR